MKSGDRLTVIQGDYSGYSGIMVGVTRDGLVTVEFGGRWTANFHPHDLEESPLTLWTLLAVPSEWYRRLEAVRLKHERTGGPDEQALADMGRSS